MTLTPDRVPVLSEESLWHNMKDGLVIVSPNQGKVRVLNETGSFIWTLVDGERSIGEIVDRIQEVYGLSAEQASQDVNIFLESLASCNVLSWVDST